MTTPPADPRMQMTLRVGHCEGCAFDDRSNDPRPPHTCRPADPVQEAVDAAAAQLLIELAFLVPKGTDLNTAIGSKLTAYKHAIEARQSALLASRQEEIERVKAGLIESVKLQSHYAELLNMHDGGQRIAFKDADEWIERLKEVKR
jgi:hypothetical protein